MKLSIRKILSQVISNNYEISETEAYAHSMALSDDVVELIKNHAEEHGLATRESSVDSGFDYEIDTMPTVRKFFASYLLANFKVDADKAEEIARGMEYYFSESLLPTVISDNDLVSITQEVEEPDIEKE